MNNAIVLTNGLLKALDAKTAHGLIRGTERFTIKGVIDCLDTAGQDAGTILDGKLSCSEILISLVPTQS